MSYQNKAKEIIWRCIYFFRELFVLRRNYLRLDWYAGGKNFGDVLNPILISAITGRRIVNISSRYCRKEHLMAIGSILDRATNETVVWGAGFISQNSVFLSKPKKICAVRGPKTRERLLELGVDCPNVFGDPAQECQDG